MVCVLDCMGGAAPDRSMWRSVSILDRSDRAARRSHETHRSLVRILAWAGAPVVRTGEGIRFQLAAARKAKAPIRVMCNAAALAQCCHTRADLAGAAGGRGGVECEPAPFACYGAHNHYQAGACETEAYGRGNHRSDLTTHNFSFIYMHRVQEHQLAASGMLVVQNKFGFLTFRHFLE